MTTVKLKIAKLQKDKGIGQRDLADVLGVFFQSVSKWETGKTMPDMCREQVEYKYRTLN